MKVVPDTIEVSKYARRALRHRYGQSGLATRADFRRWVYLLIDAALDDLCYDLLEAEKRQPVDVDLVGQGTDGE